MFGAAEYIKAFHLFFNLHLWEEKLDPYSEYKNWEYYEKSGCYSKSYRRRPSSNPLFLPK